jgi:hypothetical protein
MFCCRLQYSTRYRTRVLTFEESLHTAGTDPLLVFIILYNVVWILFYNQGS